MRVVFMGTPEFSIPSLKTLIDMRDEGVEVVGAFTQPDRPVGRGHKLEKPPVKLLAEENGIPVFQFERVRKQEGLDQMRALAPDLIVTAAFGQILSKKLLEVPKMGCINVHASLLPKHRGSAPIVWSILMGEKETGVTTMLTDVGLDTGDMLLKTRVQIGENETAGELTGRLSELGAALLRETIIKYAKGEITPEKQNEAEATYEPMLEKTMGEINWNDSAEKISCLVRGVNPWPGAYTYIGGETLKIWEAKPANADTSNCVPGEVILSGTKEGLIVACGKSALEICALQMPGGKRMSAKAYLAGKKIAVQTVLGANDGQQEAK